MKRRQRDYYAVLGVSSRAHARVIEEAYWELAFRYHSRMDRSRRASRQLRLLNEAYETLGTPSLRLAYDRARREEQAAREQARGLFHAIGRLLSRPSRA